MPVAVNLDTLDLSSLAEHTADSEIVQPGDVLDVTMVTDFAKLISTTTPVRVAEDGTMIVPLVGRVGVAGLPLEQAEQTIGAASVRAAYSALLASPSR